MGPAPVLHRDARPVNRRPEARLAPRSAKQQPPKTVCKICWLAIYQGDTTVWVISPAPGLAHIECTGQDITDNEKLNA